VQVPDVYKIEAKCHSYSAGGLKYLDSVLSRSGRTPSRELIPRRNRS
jgi:hypothetical protein